MEPEKSLSKDMLTFSTRAEQYALYMKDLETSRFKTGMGEVDDCIRGVAPGEVLTIIAYSGTFKSAILQNLLMQAAVKQKNWQLFFSMEMTAEKVFEREIQISSQVDGWTVERNFKNITSQSLSYYQTAAEAGSEKLLVCAKPRLTLEQIGRYTAVSRAKYGAIGGVGIDYLGLMRSKGQTPLEKMAELSFGVKDMAKELSVPVIQLGQVHRGYASSQGKEIETDAAKGGGDIEAAADFMFGLYLDDDGNLILKILKNRNGRKNVCFKLHIDERSLKFLGAEAYTPPKKETAKGGRF